MDNTQTYESDQGLDDVAPPPPRLPSFNKGDYELSLEKVVHVDGENGVFDIFEWKVDRATGEEANPSGSRAKISFKRDERGMKKEIADKRLVACLTALNGGDSPESNTAYIRGLRTTAAGKLRVRIGKATAEKSGNEYTTYSFFPL